jgi:hypothetical protein
MALSSAKTIFRTESAGDIELESFKQLHARLASAAQRAYASARNWIEKRKLDGLLIFNGRMDATRALLEAARDLGIPAITVERTWFSDGLLLVANDGPLDLKQHHRLNQAFRDTPLIESQAVRAAQRMVSRVRRTNDSEWRAFNKNARSVPWPAGSRGMKILILPSSRNEVDGHPDWKSGWSDFGQALDLVMERLRADRRSTVVRCHPLWGQRIGARTGELSERYYSSWGKRRDVCVLPSTDKSDTLSLIAQADLVIVNGGSAVFEASALGKPSITLCPATYSEAGFCGKAFSPAMLSDCDHALSLPSREIIKRGLRYGYTHNYRHSQFTRYVRAISPVKFRYFEGGDASRIVDLFKTGKLSPDDEEVATDEAGEREICDMIAEQQWAQLGSRAVDDFSEAPLAIQRRPLLRWLDPVRNLSARGDV